MVVALLGLLAPATDLMAVHEFLDAPRVLFGRTRTAVEAALGPPRAVRPRVLPASPGVPAVAVDALSYPGLVIDVSVRSGSVRRVSLGVAGSGLPRGLDVGTARMRVEEVLGEPQLLSDVSALYLDADGFPNTVEFHFRDGIVRRIEWSFAVE